MRNRKKINKSETVTALSVPVATVVQALLDAGFSCLKDDDNKGRGVRTSRSGSARETARIFHHAAVDEMRDRRLEARDNISRAKARGQDVSEDDVRVIRQEFADVANLSRGGRRMIFTGQHVRSGQNTSFMVPPTGHMRGTELQALLDKTGINLFNDNRDVQPASEPADDMDFHSRRQGRDSLRALTR